MGFLREKPHEHIRIDRDHLVCRVSEPLAASLQSRAPFYSFGARGRRDPDIHYVDGRGTQGYMPIRLNDKIEMVSGMKTEVVSDRFGDGRLALAGQRGNHHNSFFLLPCSPVMLRLVAANADGRYAFCLALANARAMAPTG